MWLFCGGCGWLWCARCIVCEMVCFVGIVSHAFLPLPHTSTSFCARLLSLLHFSASKLTLLLSDSHAHSLTFLTHSELARAQSPSLCHISIDAPARSLPPTQAPSCSINLWLPSLIHQDATSCTPCPAPSHYFTRCIFHRPARVPGRAPRPPRAGAAPQRHTPAARVRALPARRTPG